MLMAFRMERSDGLQSGWLQLGQDLSSTVAGEKAAGVQGDTSGNAHLVVRGEGSALCWLLLSPGKKEARSGVES